ncbi:MAG: recombinase RecA [Acidobacteria bacterium]|nr:recombinase RecA [Acidobacteriota bacterium]
MMSVKELEVRAKSFEAALAQIEKQFGKGSIMRLGQDSTADAIDVISTGVFSIDQAIGCGGIPRGRIVEVFGQESSGKTTFALQVIARAQQEKGVCAFIDAEHALSPDYAKALGVDCQNLYVSQPDSGEQALEIVDILVRSQGIDLCVIDSVAALTPRAEIEGEMGDAQMGLQARLMSQAMRKLTAGVSRSNTCLLFINQLREKIGVMFGNPETTTGGRALKFYASLRIEVKRGQTIKDGDAAVGCRTRVKIVKNKMAPPFRDAEVDLLYGEGFSIETDLLDRGVEAGVIEKSGFWFSWNGTRLGNGREQTRRFLRDNPNASMEIANALRAPANDAAARKACGA